VFHSSPNLHTPPVLRWLSGGGAVTGGEPVSSARSVCSTSALSWYSHMRVQHNPCELLVDLWHISGVLSLPLDRRAILCQLNPLLQSSLQGSLRESYPHTVSICKPRGCKVTYANNSAPRHDLGSFFNLFSVLPFRAPSCTRFFHVSGNGGRPVRRLVDGYRALPLSALLEII
jgi:hypothetical protein